MTTPLKSPAGEVPASMDDTPPPSTARPDTAAGSAPAGEPPAGGADPRPEAPEEPPVAAAQASARTGLPLRAAASTASVSNTVLLVAIVAAFLGVLGTAVGIPLHLLDGNIRGLGDGVEALEDDLKELENEMDARFAEQDAKFDAKLTALEDKMDARFAEQDARFAALENGQAEIDRKLTALIAHLQTTEAVETALEGSLE